MNFTPSGSASPASLVWAREGRGAARTAIFVAGRDAEKKVNWYDLFTILAQPGDNVKQVDLTGEPGPQEGKMAAGQGGTRQRELDEAWELMHFALRAVIAQPDRMLEKRGLSRVHHRILFFVARRPDLTVNQLLQILQVSKQALNQPLRQLYTQGLVAYTLAPHDKRHRRLALSAAGRALERRLTGPQRALFDAALSAAGARGEAAWRRVMGAMAEEEMKRSGRE